MIRGGWDFAVVVGNQLERANIRYLTNFEDFYGGETILVVPADGTPGFTPMRSRSVPATVKCRRSLNLKGEATRIAN